MARALTLFALLSLATGCSSLDFGRFTPGDASADSGTDGATDTGARDADMDDADAAEVDTGLPVETCDGIDDDGDMVIDEDAVCPSATPYCVSGACADDQPEEVSAGAFHSCVRMASGRVYCWGDNRGRQAGGTADAQPMPGMVRTIGDEPLLASALAMGWNHSCALDMLEQPYCWGDDTDGKLTARPRASRDPSNVALAAYWNGGVMSIQAQHVAAGMDFTLFGAGTTLFAGGVNGEGQFGHMESSAARDGATDYPNLFGEDLASLSAGAQHACALLVNGQVYCWGNRGEGQTSDLAESTPPVLVPMTYKAVDAGDQHNCAIDMMDGVRCWGDNSLLQSGHDSGSQSANPLPVLGATDAREVSAGGSHTCMIDQNDVVYCWGDNTSSQLGRSDVMSSSMPITVDLGLDEGAITMSAGYGHACAITTHRRVICWGDNTTNQSGPGEPGTPVTPQRVDLSGAR